MLSQEGATQADRIVGLFTWTFPSVCLLSVCNVMFNDALLFGVRIVGIRLPKLVQRCLRAANATLNLVIAAIGYLWVYGSCKPAVDVCSSNVLMEVDCSKTTALALCTVFAFSVSDRFSTVLLYPDQHSSFMVRMGESGGVVIAWQLVGEREGLAPLFVALLIARRARFALPRISQYACGFLRVLLAAIAFNALGKNCNTVSQKASVGILLSVLLLKSPCPRERVSAQASPPPQPVPVYPRRKNLARRRRALAIFTAPTTSRSSHEPTTTTILTLTPQRTS